MDGYAKSIETNLGEHTASPILGISRTVDWGNRQLGVWRAVDSFSVNCEDFNSDGVGLIGEGPMSLQVYQTKDRMNYVPSRHL